MTFNQLSYGSVQSHAALSEGFYVNANIAIHSVTYSGHTVSSGILYLLRASQGSSTSRFFKSKVEDFLESSF